MVTLHQTIKDDQQSHEQFFEETPVIRNDSLDLLNENEVDFPTSEASTLNNDFLDNSVVPGVAANVTNLSDFEPIAPDVSFNGILEQGDHGSSFTIERDEINEEDERDESTSGEESEELATDDDESEHNEDTPRFIV